MLRRYSLIKILIYANLGIAILLASLMASQDVRADDEVEDRTATITVKVTEHTWWLVQWSDNEVVCELAVDHEGLPKHWEIDFECEYDVFDEWEISLPCEEANEGGDTSNCPGLYLHYVGSREVEKEVIRQLPVPIVWVSLRGCAPTSFSNLCDSTPYIEFTAEEPLPFEIITSIQAELEAGSFSCSSDYCFFPLTPEYEEGIEIEFWAESSYGDESEHFTALIRAIELDDDEVGESHGWQVDVISSQWQGGPLASCALTWGAFPPVGNLPSWLSTPDDASGLATNETFELLAGRLLRWGLVEAPNCPFGGLMADGSANNCGVEQTRDFVYEWQDRFDSRIFEVAKEIDVPTTLLKRLFAEESQFWPGAFPNMKEYGLGGLHSHGGDVLLLWNQSFYQKFCPLMLSPETCSERYDELDEENQVLLRGALTLVANVSCPECPGGVDLEMAELSVDLFGNILRANCDQVGQTVGYIAGDRPGAMSSYEDLWRFVMVNYNAGPGCLATALDIVWENDDPFDWDHLKKELLELEACDGSVDYVEAIASE